jgi:prepilin-type N-terminal cleavage/methylation domain-containing protein
MYRQGHRRLGWARARARGRQGFTLIEMLLVIGIILFLFGLVAAFLPAVYKRDDSTRAAQMVQTRLAMARQRARRDNLACGIRFAPDTTLPGPPRFVTNLAMVQQPLDIVGRPDAPGLPGIALHAPAANSNLVIINGANLATVNPGDFLTIAGSGVPHRILGVDAANGGLRLASNLYYPIPITHEFRIQRQPTAAVGEVTVKLPGKICVDLILCSVSNPSKPAMFTLMPAGIDIVFSPNGDVIGDWSFLDKICLFVRDYTDPDVKTGGSPAIVSIQVRTGFISVHPVDPFDAYSRASDPRASGL